MMKKSRFYVPKGKGKFLKKMHVIFSAGIYRSTEKGYKFAKYLKIFILQFKFDLNFFYPFFIHFRPFPSD